MSDSRTSGGVGAWVAHQVAMPSIAAKAVGDWSLRYARPENFYEAPRPDGTLYRTKSWS
jgi:hypothetical protein